MTATATAVRRSSTRAGGRRAGLGHAVDVLLDPPVEGDTLRSRLAATPLHTWLFLLGLTASLTSRWSSYIGLPISLDRVLIPVAVVLLLLDGRRPRQFMTVVHWLTLVLVAWIAIDMLLRGMVTDREALFGLLDRVLIPFLLFLLGPLFFDTPFRRRVLLVWLAVLGVYLGLTAIFETFAPSLVVPSYIVNPDLGLHPDRARGPFMAADAMGTAGGLTVAVGAFLAARSRGVVRWLGVVAVALGLASTVLSLTRATWVGAAAGFLVAVLMVPVLRRLLPVLVAAGAAIVTLVVVTLPELVASLTDRANDPRPVWDRLGSNDAALALLTDRPLTGIGWRRFYPHGSEWFRQSDAYPTNAVVIEIHNVVLSRAVELGVVAGAIFVLILLLGPGRTLWSRTDAAAPAALGPEFRDWRVLGAAVFLNWFVAGMFGPMAIPFPTLATFVLCGVAASPYLVADPDELSTAESTP